MANKVTDPSADDPDTAAAALLVGTLTLAAPTSIPKDLGGRDAAVETFERDGTTALPVDEYELGDGLGGNVSIQVFGRFQSGDMVYLGTRAMSISGPVASATMGIEALLQAVEPGDTGGSIAVVYVPGGVDDLRPGGIAAQAMLDFNEADNNAMVYAGPARADGAVRSSVGVLSYDGFDDGGYAYGVVKSGGTDQSYVRITCGSTTTCRVFLDCNDQAGASYFGELDSIASGATAVVSSDEIATTLGGGWTMGRGRCDLLSDAGANNLRVQHMVRSGHTLVNSSLVVTDTPGN